VRAELNAAARHTRGEEPRARRRRPLEAMAPEGHRPGARGLDPRPSLDRRRSRLPADDALLRVKVNRKVARAALRGALADHARGGTLGLIRRLEVGGARREDGRWFRRGVGPELPLVLIMGGEETNLAKSFRNLDRVAVVTPAELEVARRLGTLAARLADALEALEAPRRERFEEGGRGVSLSARQVLIAPVVSEKSYSLIEARKYAFFFRVIRTPTRRDPPGRRGVSRGQGRRERLQGQPKPSAPVKGPKMPGDWTSDFFQPWLDPRSAQSDALGLRLDLGDVHGRD